MVLKRLKRIGIFLSLTLFCALNALPYALTDILPSTEQIEKETKAFSLLVDRELDLFVRRSQEKEFDQAYAAWSHLYSDFFSIKLMYGQVITLSPDAAWKESAQRHFLEMKSYFQKRLHEPRILETFAANGLSAASLTPWQREITEKILQDTPNAYPKSLAQLNRYERTNFVQERFPQNDSAPKETLRVFTANVLCFPDNLSYLYGGASPWPERIDRLADAILKTQADFVCLQEVWDIPCMHAFVKRLKSEYTDFIYDAGNSFDTLDLDSMGFNSGVFIASRIPLDTVNFTPFAECIPSKGGARRGAVHGTFALGQEQWSFAGTHMQYGYNADQIAVRQTQLAQCIELLQPNRERGFLLGDLNINAFSPEFRDSSLSSQFAIPYLNGQTAITPDNATATDYFNDLVRTPPQKRTEVERSYELLDYCAGFKGAFLSTPLFQEKIALYTMEDPDGILSDHQGLLTVWKIKTAQE